MKATLQRGASCRSRACAQHATCSGPPPPAAALSTPGACPSDAHRCMHRMGIYCSRCSIAHRRRCRLLPLPAAALLPAYAMQGCAHRHFADLLQEQRLPSQWPVAAGPRLLRSLPAGGQPGRRAALLGLAQGPAAPALLCARAAHRGGGHPRRRLLRRGQRLGRRVCVGDLQRAPAAHLAGTLQGAACPGCVWLILAAAQLFEHSSCVLRSVTPSGIATCSVTARPPGGGGGGGGVTAPPRSAPRPPPPPLSACRR